MIHRALWGPGRGLTRLSRGVSPLLLSGPVLLLLRWERTGLHCSQEPSSVCVGGVVVPPLAIAVHSPRLSAS